MKYVVTMNGKRYEVEVERMSAFHMLTREEIASGVSTPVQPVAAPAPKAAAPAPAAAAPAPAAAAPAPAAAPAGVAGSITVESPMPGKILSVEKKVGDSVEAGQTIMILEAMKMENEIVAPEAGTIASINVSVNQSVEAGEVLATLN